MKVKYIIESEKKWGWVELFSFENFDEATEHLEWLRSAYKEEKFHLVREEKKVID